MPVVLLRLEEAAVRLGMSYSVLRGVIDRGEIKAIKIGRRGIRIDEEELNRYLAEAAKRG